MIYMSNGITSREQYEDVVNLNIDIELSSIEDRTSPLNLNANTFFKQTSPSVVDSTYFLESNDDWGLPFPFGWIAIDSHFTNTPEQDYYTDNIIEVRYD